MKRLQFRVSIAAPKETVWNTMLQPDSYRQWTASFAEGSYYEGSWDQGAKIRFLIPSGEGMAAEIAENRKYEYISIRQLGTIKDGVEDTDSPEVRAWAPAYETYTFSQTRGGTEVIVEADVTEPEYEQMFEDMWPKALSRLKQLCES